MALLPQSPWLWMGAGVGAGLAVRLAMVVAPMLAIDPLWAFGLGFAAVSVWAIGVAMVVPLEGALPVGWALLCVLFLVAQSVGQWSELWVAPCVTAALLGCCTQLGAVLGRRITHAGHLLFVAWVSAIADAVSVFHPAGVTHAVAQSARALSVVALPFPMLGTADVVPFLGAGDVLFVAIYLTATRRLGLRVRRTVVGLALGLTCTLWALLSLQVVVPALPMLGAGVLLMQPATWRPPKEQRGLAIGLAVTLSVAAALLWVMGRH